MKGGGCCLEDKCMLANDEESSLQDRARGRGW